MIGYTVTADKEQLAGAIKLFEFIGGNTSDAMRIAINKTLPIAKTAAAKEIAKDVNLKAAYIKEKLDPIKATRQNLTGRIRAESRGTLLSRFEYGAKAALIGKIVFPDTPIRVKVNPGAGQIKTVTGSKSPVPVYGKPFLFKLKNAQDGIGYGIGMFRKESGKNGGRIQAFHGTSVSQSFNNAREAIEPEVSAVYQKQLIDAMRYVLQKQYPSE